MAAAQNKVIVTCTKIKKNIQTDVWKTEQRVKAIHAHVHFLLARLYNGSVCTRKDDNNILEENSL